MVKPLTEAHTKIDEVYLSLKKTFMTVTLHQFKLRMQHVFDKYLTIYEIKDNFPEWTKELENQNSYLNILLENYMDDKPMYAPVVAL